MGGVVGLFKSLSDAGLWIEHRFWRELLNEYSSPRDSEQALTKLRKDITKSAEDFVQQYSIRKVEAITWFAHTALRSLRNIPQIRDTFTYSDLTIRWEHYLTLLGPKEKELAEFQWRENPLAKLCNRGILLQGCKVRCERCLSVYWYHIDDLRSEFPCEGCREQIRLPVELPWSYKLNDLVRTAIREHGVCPALRTANFLITEAKTFFKLLAGVELCELVQKVQLVGELDLCWVSDGRFGICEVKTSAKDFTATERSKIVKLAKRVQPDEVLLAAVEGQDSAVEYARSEIEEQLDGILVRCLLPSALN